MLLAIALILAAREGNVEAVKAELARGAAVDERGGVNDWTALMHAIHKRQTEAALVLLEHGADVNARGRKGGTPLLLAASQGELRIVRELLERGADPRLANESGVTPLAAAVAKGDSGVVDALLAHDPSLRLPAGMVGFVAQWSGRLHALIRGHSLNK